MVNRSWPIDWMTKEKKSCFKLVQIRQSQQWTTTAYKKISQQAVEHVKHFQYMGSYISKNDDATADVTVRIGKAASTFQRLRPIWSSKTINKTVKLRLYIVVDSATNGSLCCRNLENIGGYNKLDVQHQLLLYVKCLLSVITMLIIIILFLMLKFLNASFCCLEHGAFNVIIWILAPTLLVVCQLHYY